MRTQPAIVEAVILAAGNGSRLNLPHGEPKPLATVGGVTLIERIVRSAVRAGVKTVHIVTGHRAARLQSGAFSKPPACAITWVHNPRYEEPNGISLLSAEGAVSGPFLLLMADHLFEQRTLDRLMTASERADAEVVMAVDSNVDGVWDIDDATKVMTVDSRLTTIGKTLQSYNAIDTGMFLCGTGVFEALRTSVAAGDASLSGGMATLAGAGRVRTFDITGARWIDVDTPSALETAGRMIDAAELS